MKPCICQRILQAACRHREHELGAGRQQVLQETSSAKPPNAMNTEIPRGSVHSATRLTPNSPLQGEVCDHFWDHVPARAFSEQHAVTRSTILEQGGQQVLQATSSAKTPSTKNTETQKSSVHSATPPAPNNPLQGKAGDHF